MRAQTAANLQCFVPGCPTPAFTTVARQGRRDGFRHLVGGNHAPESLFHRQGKQALVDWLAATHPHVEATNEVPLPDRTRVADVLAKADFGGFALEVQYASLAGEGTHESWQARTDDYARAALRSVWFFGHSGTHMTVLPTGKVSLNAVQRHVVAAGDRLWWLNPTTAQVATAYVDVVLEGRTFHVPPRPDDPVVNLAISPLLSAVLDHDGFHNAEVKHLECEALAYTAVLAAGEARRLAAEQARAEEARKQAQALEAAARRRAARREAQAQEWLASSTCANVRAAHGGSIPAYLDHETASDAIDAYHQRWQATVYGHVMRGHTGDRIALNDCLTVLAEQGIRYRADAIQVMNSWLRFLVQEFHLARLARSDRWVVTDPEDEGARRAALRAAREERPAKQAELQAAELGHRVALQAKSSERHQPELRRELVANSNAGPVALCRACGHTLASQLAAAGVDLHVGCPDPDQLKPSHRRSTTRTCRGCAYPLAANATSRYHTGCEPWASLAAKAGTWPVAPDRTTPTQPASDATAVQGVEG